MNIEKALRSPDKLFNSPAEVVENNELNLEEKIKVLKQWEYDIREMSVAEEENMPGNGNAHLITEISTALERLGIEYDEEESGGDTKHGGV